MDFITNLLELNRYNTLYIMVNHNLTKAIVFILCIKIINTIEIVRLYHNNIQTYLIITCLFGKFTQLPEK